MAADKNTQAQVRPGPSVSDEIQLLLSEKRTALSLMRTGIAVFALPISALSVLIATSRLYDFQQVLHFLIPLMLLILALVLLGTYLVGHAFTRIRSYDRIIQRLKGQYPVLAEIEE
jgi:uncharacterized membrane protein YidH (DUF202 family)